MSLFPALAVKFSVAVTTSTGAVVAGASVVIRNAANADVTAAIMGASPVVTGPDGVLSHSNPFSVVPAGTYTITVSAAGYAPQTISTASTFAGFGVYSVVLVRSLTPPAHTITLVSEFVSVYASIPVTVHFTDTVKPDLLEMAISQANGNSSLMRVAVNKGTGIATAYVQSRIRLDPTPVFVPTGSLFIVDPYFSDVITITLSCWILGERVELGTTATFAAANLYPTGSVNTLTDFAGTSEPGHLREWIAPDKSPTVIAGYYYDVMVWLPLADESPSDAMYSLKRAYLKSDGASVSTATNSVTPSSKIQRLILTKPANPLIAKAEYYVTNELNERITKTLTVNFRG